MSRLLLIAVVVVTLGAAVAFSGARFLSPAFVFQSERVNPVTHYRFADAAQEFSFAIVSDRTGGHRANIFSQAVERLNLMQPQFVVSVGDLIEGGKAEVNPTKQWQEFDSFVGRLQMPFFYVPGNHDAGSVALTKFWKEKLGRRYYDFTYRDVLFLMLNSDDMPGTYAGAISKDQIAYVEKTLADNKDVRWTLVFIHRPLWSVGEGKKNGWVDVEKALAGRKYTVFAGHIHHFQKFVRQGMNYYQLATTGGSSLVRGVEYGEFDHISWVTMKNNGPLISHVALDAILPENLQPVITNEPGGPKVKSTTYPVDGKVYFEGSPIPGAVVSFLPSGKEGAKASGKVEADGSFRLSSFKPFDGAAAGDYQVTVSWTDPRTGTPLLPANYGRPNELRAKVTAAGPNHVVLELKR